MSIHIKADVSATYTGSLEMRGCLAVVLLVALGVAHAQDADTPKKIVISAGTLVEALDKLTLQSGVQIMYDPDAARGVEVAPVIGTYTVRDALARLLSKTALRIESVNEKTVVLKRTNTSSGTPDPADQMRLAAFGEEE